MGAMKPILFNTDMVRAIQEGRKSVTRRVVRLKELDEVLSSPARKENPDVPDSRFIECLCTAPCEAGDILWVRETWQVKRGGGYLYKADTVKSFDLFITPDGQVVNEIPWRPSIHMPREAARIFLRVTDVRVERLQDITPEQIDTEGCKELAYSATTGELLPSGASWFRIAWNNTIKPKDLPAYGWEANPWVWVIEFERIEKEIEGCHD